MAQLVAPADFENFFALARGIKTDPVIQDYIDRYHDTTIRKLLGKDLGNLFIADIPAFGTPRLATLNNPFTEQDNNLVRESRGMQDLLLAVIFYHYIFDQQNQSSQSGVAKRDVEAGFVNSPENAARFAEAKWNNDMMDTWENIQWYCKTFDPATYPDFKGEPITPRWSAVI